MKTADFCIWLRGFLDGADTRNGLGPDKLKPLMKTLDSVFTHEVPEDHNDTPKEITADFSDFHEKIKEIFVEERKSKDHDYPWRWPDTVKPLPGYPKPPWEYDGPGPNVHINC